MELNNYEIHGSLLISDIVHRKVEYCGYRIFVWGFRYWVYQTILALLREIDIERGGIVKIE